MPVVDTSRFHAAIQAETEPCGVVRTDAGQLVFLSNLAPLELADLFERAAGLLRAGADPEFVQLT